jgi:DNA-directed RNA polymerase specialized sigma24 family protein
MPDIDDRESLPLSEDPARALIREHWDTAARFAQSLRTKMDYESVISAETAVEIGHSVLTKAAPRWTEEGSTAQFSTLLYSKVQHALQDEARRPARRLLTETKVADLGPADRAAQDRKDRFSDADQDEDRRLAQRDAKAGFVKGQSAEDMFWVQDPEESFWRDMKGHTLPSHLVQTFIDTLTKQQQEALHLVAMQGFDHAQAAASMGITRQTLETHLRKAREVLAAPGAAEDPEMRPEEFAAIEDAKRRIRARVEAG